MSALTTVLIILQLISAVAIVVVVLVQSGKSAGLSGAIAGGSDTFLSRNKTKSRDAKLARATKWFGLAFMVLTLVIGIIQ